MICDWCAFVLEKENPEINPIDEDGFVSLTWTTEHGTFTRYWHLKCYDYERKRVQDLDKLFTSPSDS